ncbi:uncharacterized protein RJT21DRAFT_17015 [Scheffersomyces amazonensis]|uniref:uncharacterized protein n=1 Tax=Scheffersomyces amazonensis TaxID=1078765 RepID=UPI00315DD072
MALLSRVLNHNSDKSGGKRSRSSSLQSSGSTSPSLRSFTRSRTNSGLTVNTVNTSPSSPNSINHNSNNASYDPAYSLSIHLESPPIVLYGNPTESTGSIISGVLNLQIRNPNPNPNPNSNSNPTRTSNELRAVTSYPLVANSTISSNSSSTSSSASTSSHTPPSSPSIISTTITSSPFTYEFDSVTISLIQTVKISKPFIIPSSSIQNCPTCTIKKTTLARWDVLTSPCAFPVGKHAYPFSHLLPGSLPATSKLGSINSSSSIKYELIVIAKRPNRNNQIQKDITLTIPIRITRSILRGPDRNSLRVFPPTEITASAVLPNVIYPKSNLPIELRLNNIVSNHGDRRWRMRKLSWRIEELVKLKASTCEKHASKLHQAEVSQRKIANKDSSSNPGFHNKSNVHYSTIQTNLSIQRDPLITSNVFQNHPLIPTETTMGGHNASNVDTISENDIDNDMSGAIQSAPINAHDNFIEDFGSTITSSSTNNPSTPITPVASSINPQGTNNEDDEHLYIEELRTISHGDIKSGWKSDFSDRGKIELVAEINAFNFNTGLNNHISKVSTDDDPKIMNNATMNDDQINVSCDIEDPTLGIYVNHTLVIEVIVAEELVHNLERKRARSQSTNRLNNDSDELITTSSTTSNTGIGSSTSSTPKSQSQQPQVGVPTGAARVLRMQFKLCLTERSGLGIAWDDEVPPTYEDVRALSPPTYDNPRHYELSSPSSQSQTPTSIRSNSSTPNVLYGIGETPIVGSFGLRTQASSMTIDGMIDLDDRIQELAL